MQPTVIRYDTVASTNTIAWEFAVNGCADATVILAERQGAGRGRLSRNFQSPPGGLYMSLVLRPDLPNAKLSLMTIAAGIACAEAIRLYCGVEVALKWPNDLYLGTRKLGGILTEAAPYSPLDEKGAFLVIGIGININTRRASFSPELQDTVTSLYDVSSREYEIEALLAAIVRELYSQVTLLRNHHEKVLSRWRRSDYLFKRRISWRNTRGELLTGYGYGLLPDGQYQIRTDDGTLHPILAGDIIVG